MGSSSVLWENERKTVVLLDLPRTLEEAQMPSSQLDASKPLRRIISAKPPETPYTTPEPKVWDPSLSTSSHSAQVTELMTRGFIDAALDELNRCYAGPWCLPRFIPESVSGDVPLAATKTKREGPVDAEAFIPKNAKYLLGTIEAKRKDILKAPPFHAVIMDPPWPNRSARRKRNNYQLADGFDAMEDLLSQIPMKTHLRQDGLLAVWVTNSPRATELLTRPGGMFEKWGVELVGEWTWLKVTTQGEPIVSLDSQWRKPWERLLLAARPGRARDARVQNMVIVAVPDMHSRKPNLRSLFEPLMPSGFAALEVFSRSLTADWYAWGNEVLFYQQDDQWEAKALIGENEIEC